MNRDAARFHYDCQCLKWQ